MSYNINSEEEYRQVMEKMESYLQKATHGGGFYRRAATDFFIHDGLYNEVVRLTEE